MNINLEKIEDATYHLLTSKEQENIDKEIIKSEVLKIFKVYHSEGNPSESDVETIVKRLMQRLEIDMVIGQFFASSYQPWLDEKRKDINWRYSDRYNRFLAEENFPNKVIKTISRDTDQILDLAEDPSKSGSWSRKGLVVGHVQSGKTANYISNSKPNGIPIFTFTNNKKTLTQLTLIGSSVPFYLSGLNSHEKTVNNITKILKKYYGNKHVVYLGNYLEDRDNRLKMSDEELLEIFLPYLKKINSNFRKSWITRKWKFQSPFAQPVFPVGYSKMVDGIKTDDPDYYVANMSMVYPWDRGVNFAVELGQKAAKMIINGK